MKKLLRYSFIIYTLAFFSSCAEQFREIRGSQSQGNAFLGGGLTTTTTKPLVNTQSERATPHQTVLPVEEATSEMSVESNPNRNPIESNVEKVEAKQGHILQGQKSNASGKPQKGRLQSVKKTKHLKPAKFLKKAIWRQGNRNSKYSFLESPYSGGIGDWLLFFNVILPLIFIGLLLIYMFIDLRSLGAIISLLIPSGLSLYQYLTRESLDEESGLFRFSFWLIAASLFALLITSPLAILQFTQYGPPRWSIMIFALLMLGLGLHVIAYIDKFLGYLFDSWSDKHWIVRLLLGMLLLSIILLTIAIVGYSTAF